ncbi:MAG TPA: tRNA lysidine(34) synthetase TilS [Fimbriiglobus sp.]
MSRVVAEVRRFFATNGLVGTPGVVAVSGGADSVALLRAILETNVAPVRAVHFDHMLRGAESDGDAEFVGRLAARLGVPFQLFHAGESTLANDNLEAAARAWRYETLAAVALEFGLKWTATGHSADDQVETVLHRLIRGTGIQGLRGIAPVRYQDHSLKVGPPIVRPLLTLSRAEVVEYLTSLDQTFRTDSTNADPRFTRNRIRHELLPLLKTYNPDIVITLTQTAQQAEELFATLRQEAEELLKHTELPRAGNVLVFDAIKLDRASPHRVRDLFRLVYEREHWPMSQMTHAHWRRLAALTEGDYPEGVILRIKGRVVQLARRT